MLNEEVFLKTILRNLCDRVPAVVYYQLMLERSICFRLDVIAIARAQVTNINRSHQRWLSI